MRLLLFLCTCFLLVLSQHADYFSKDDSDRLQDFIVKTQGKDGTWGNAADTHYAVKTLETLGTKIPKSKEASSALQKTLLEKNNDVATIYHAVQALDALGQYDLPAVAVPIIRKSLHGDLQDIYYGAETIFTLSAKNKIQLSEFEWAKIISALVELLDEEGGARSNADSDDANAVNAGLVFQIIGGVVSRVKNLEHTGTEAVKTAISQAKEIAQSGFQEGILDFSGDSSYSNLVATTVVFKGLNSLQSAVERKLGVPESFFHAFANFLLANKYVGDVESAYFLTQGLSVANDNAIHIPLVLSLVDPRPAHLAVKVTTIFAKSIPATVVLTQASSGGSVLFKDGSFTPKADVYHLDSSASINFKDAKPGVYSLRFSATPKGSDERYKQFVTTRHAKVLAEIKDIDLEVFVSDSAKGLGGDKANKIRHPRQLSQKLSASADKYVHFKISFGGTGFEPNQVFIQLIKDKTSNDAVFVAQSAGLGVFNTKLSVASSEFQETIFGSGDYQINLIIGDELLQQAVIWEIGHIDLQLSSPDPTPVEDPFRIFPEIHHQFQKPEPRPARAISAVFSVVVLLPFLWLLLQVSTSHVDWDVPTGAEWISAMLFQVSIAAILVGYFIYWVALNIFEALLLTGILGVVAIFFGSRALKERHRRVSKEA